MKTSITGEKFFLQNQSQKVQRTGCTRKIDQHGMLHTSISRQLSHMYPSNNNQEGNRVPSSITSQWPGMWPVKVQTLIMG
jgi:hypothetical protein